MHIFIKYLLCLALMGGIIACERTLEIPLPEHQPSLVANAMVVSDEPMRIIVSHSLGLNQDYNGASVYLTDATVTLSQDGQAPQTLFYREFSRREFGYYSSQLALPGSHYVLRVTHPDYPDLRQEMTLPSRPRVTAIQGTPGLRLSEEGFRLDRVTYDLQDPPDTANYYALEATFRMPPVNPSDPPRNFNFDWRPTGADANSYSALGFHVLLDEPFDGQAASIQFETDILDRLFQLEVSDLQRGYFVFRLLSLNEPIYRYGAELGGHQSSVLFFEFDFAALNQSPLPMYSNAEGGFGIFGGYTMRVDTLRL